MIVEAAFDQLARQGWLQIIGRGQMRQESIRRHEGVGYRRMRRFVPCATHEIPPYPASCAIPTSTESSRASRSARFGTPTSSSSAHPPPHPEYGSARTGDCCIMVPGIGSAVINRGPRTRSRMDIGWVGGVAVQTLLTEGRDGRFPPGGCFGDEGGVRWGGAVGEPAGGA